MVTHRGRDEIQTITTCNEQGQCDGHNIQGNISECLQVSTQSLTFTLTSSASLTDVSCSW